MKELPKNVERLPSGSLRIVHSQNGRRFYRTVPGNLTRAQIEIERARLVLEVGQTPARTRTTLRTMIAELHEDWSKGPNTLADRQRVVERFFPDELLDTDVTRITTLDVRDFYRSLRAQGLSEHRIGRCADVLGSTLQHAAALGVIAANPARNAPRPTIERREIDPPTPEAVEAILDSIPFGWLAVAVELAFVTGARRGEVVALRWDDFDLDDPEGPVVSIHRSAIVTALGVEIKDTKTGRRGRRNVAIDAATVELLRRWRACTPGDWVFPSPTGTGPRRSDGLTQAWSKHLAAAGLPHVRLHDLRHFAVTRAIMAGHPISLVSRRFGHSSTAVTQDRYGHLVPAADRAIAASVAATVRRRARA